jgi:S-DNA-T family DNA segregation ATPase FtsK/SpoIIIE
MLSAAHRVLYRSLGLVILLLAAALAVALISYQPSDPSLNHATAAAARNLVGAPGALVADLLLQGFGFAAALAVLPLAIVGMRIAGGGPPRAVRLSFLTLAALPLSAAACGLALPVGTGPASAGPAIQTSSRARKRRTRTGRLSARLRPAHRISRFLAIG